VSVVAPHDISVFCDQEADRKLLHQIRVVSEFLSEIPEENIQILPRGNELRSDRLASIVDLATYDRPDFIFLYRGVPILVCELTEHGYTGDNPLQRFTRFATTAENRLPFIYFTPFSRVRDDELDTNSDREASKRKVNTNVWKGMSRLTEIYDVPQIAVEWVLAPNGKARKPGLRPTYVTINAIYGELLKVINAILQLAPAIAARTSIVDESYIQAETQKVKALWQVANTRESSIREVWPRSQLVQLLGKPTTLLERVTRTDYFFKDKPERLLALQCISVAKIEQVVGISTKLESVAQALEHVLSSPVFNEPLLYYTGYQWRSDPHCGVAVNIDYLYCRSPKGRTPIERDHALVLFYPRIFFSRDSQAYKTIIKDISDLNERRGSFYKLFLDRYGSVGEADRRIDQLLLADDVLKHPEELIGIWGDGTKQSRIFRQYCDLVVLSDAVILGNHWQAR
jgi:hypothetical protein